MRCPLWFSCLLTLSLTLAACGEPTDPSANSTTKANNTTQADMGVDMSAPPDMDTGPTGDPVRVATFNVKQLFDTVCDSGACRPSDFEKAPDQGAFDQKVQLIQEGIRTLDADIVVLQEIENEAAFAAVYAPLKDTYPTRVFGEIGGSATVDVAVLSRWDHRETRKHRDSTPLTTASGSRTRFAREFLEVHLSKNGRRAVIFAAHFTSKASDSTGDRRAAEAKAAAEIALATAATLPTALVVVAGDLNDTPTSVPLQNMTNAGLVNAVYGKPLDDLYTFVYRGERQVIDHILYVPHENTGYRLEESQAFHDPGLNGFGSSDHGAVRATFYIR